jgi:Septum formation
VNERWVCKRCFADNEDSAGACQRCGLMRGSESTEADQGAWAAAPQAASGNARGGGLLSQVLRFWWIPAVAIALVVGYFTTAQRGDDGSLSTAGNVTVDDLRAGDCFNQAEFASSEEVEVSDVDGAPCTEPHAFEVYVVANYGGEVFPGTDSQFRVAFGEVCVPPFEDYVGIPYADSMLWASAITPTEEGWNAGDREFICYLHEERATMLSESQRGAAR